MAQAFEAVGELACRHSLSDVMFRIPRALHFTVGLLSNPFLTITRAPKPFSSLSLSHLFLILCL